MTIYKFPDEVCPKCKEKVVPLSNQQISGGVMYCPKCKEASPYGETTISAMHKWEQKYLTPHTLAPPFHKGCLHAK